MNTLRVGLIQMSMVSDIKKNLAHALSMAEKAVTKGAKLICLPELFRSLYFPQKQDSENFRLAETIPGPSTTAFSKFARTHKVDVVVSLFERRTGGLYHNTAVLINKKGELAGKSRKMHIPHDPSFEEKYYFAPGDTGFCALPGSFAKIGALTCWDQWYPEGARLLALDGAQILFYPTAIGWFKADPPALRSELYDAWCVMQRSHGIANGTFVCAVNRVGVEGKLVFWGGSFISDPFGKVIARAAHDKEEILIADLDLEKITATREAWPFLRDRRIDAYGDLTKRYID